jgi:hypothetical protein
VHRALVLLPLLAGCPTTIAGNSGNSALEVDASAGDLVTIDAAFIAADGAEGSCTFLPEQSGCAAEQSCDLDPAMPTETLCRAAGTGEADDTCVDQGDCAVGWTCLGGAGNPALRHCSKLCDGNEDCGAGAACTVPITGLDQKTCTVVCGLVDGLGCPATGWMCTTLAGFTFCAAEGSAAPGASCANQLDCGSGYVCAGAAGAGTCRERCRITAPASGCTAGACKPFATPGIYNGVEFGFCG